GSTGGGSTGGGSTGGGSTGGGSTGGGSTGGAGGNIEGGGSSTSTNLSGTFPATYFIANPLAKVQLQSSNFSSANGLGVSQARPGEQITIATSFKNYQQSEQSYAMIIQIVDSEGFTADLGWVTGNLTSGQTANSTRSWTAEQGSHTVEMFVWDDVDQAPTPLSVVTTKTFEVT
ncbi:MAG: hypothetical protein ACREAI_07850, partial [Nitrososphaera sp.]